MNEQVGRAAFDFSGFDARILRTKAESRLLKDAEVLLEALRDSQKRQRELIETFSQIKSEVGTLREEIIARFDGLDERVRELEQG